MRRIQEALERLPGNSYEFTQPIQMRFNELMAGVRGDLAVKVFGDEFGPMLARRRTRSPASCAASEGAEDVRVEQAAGLPFLEITVDKAEIARRGLSVAAVQDVIGAAIGGREAGFLFEGDRRFAIVVRLPGRGARRPGGAAEPAGAAAQGRAPSGESGAGMPHALPLRSWPTSASPRDRTRSAARTASAGWWCRPTCAAATSRSVVAEAQAAGGAEVQLPAGYWIDMGRAVREPRRGAPAAHGGGAGLLLPDLPACSTPPSARRATPCWCSAPCRWR